MSKTNSRYSTLRLFTFLILITIIWLLYLVINHRPLNFDEAQYWLWSQHLSWGYHSKPPAIAWFIKITTSIFGNKPFGVIVAVPIINLCTSLLLFFTVRLTNDQKTAWWSAISFMLLPSVILSSSIISTDPFTLCFWALGIFSLVKLTKTNNNFYWILISIANALAILSKYTGFIFTLSLIIYFVTDKQQRYRFKQLSLYGYLLLTIFLISPNILWNIQHGFAAIKHVAYHNAGINHWHWHALGPITFIGQQLIAFSIILFSRLLWIITHPNTYTKNTYQKLYLWFCLPTLCIFFINSIISSNDINWAITAFVSATPLVVQSLITKQLQKWLRFNIIVSIVIWTMFYSAELTGAYTHNKHILYFHPYRKFIQWQQPAPAIKSFVDKHQHAAYLFDNRKIWANFSYFGRLPLDNIFFWKDDNDYSIDTITKLSTQCGHSFLFVTINKPNNKIKSDFKSINLITSIDGTIDPKYPFILYIYQLNKLICNPHGIAYPNNLTYNDQY